MTVRQRAKRRPIRIECCQPDRVYPYFHVFIRWSNRRVCEACAARPCEC